MGVLVSRWLSGVLEYWSVEGIEIANHKSPSKGFQVSGVPPEADQENKH
jgi:hypothetical protein